MSRDCYTWAWKQDAGSSTNLLVLLCVADRADQNGRCFPSQAWIAGKCGLSPRAVYDALKALEGRSLLSRTKRTSAAGRSSDLIQLTLSKLVLFEHGPPEEDTETAPTKTAGGVEGPLAPGATTPPHDVREPPAGGAKDTVSYPREESPGGPGAFDYDVLGAEVFAACGAEIQEKLGGECRRIIFALRDAHARGGDPRVIAAATIAFVTHGDQLKRDPSKRTMPNRFIDDNRWVHWVGREPDGKPTRTLDTSAKRLTEIEFEGKTWAIPPDGEQDKIGSYASPGIQLQLSMLDRWNKVDREPHRWETKWGPAPGRPGCLLWPAVLEDAGLPATPEGKAP